MTILLIEKTKKKVKDLDEFQNMMKKDHDVRIGED